MKGINIFSGEKGLGGALTNPTVLARRKGCIAERYTVTFNGRSYSDVESAYHELKIGNPSVDDEMMVNLIAQKFQDHPTLQDDVTQHGGSEFLAACSHFTNAKTPGSQSWEGQGIASRFIRNLILGYDRSLEGPAEHLGQVALF